MDKKKLLSKILSHALRHEPEKYGIILDNEGWVDIGILVTALKINNYLFSNLSEDDIYLAVEQYDKKRHQIIGGKIRAMYGHSIYVDVIYNKKPPPTNLYHGTSQQVENIILNDGLKPMKRNFVHLSSSIEAAYDIGKRKDKNPIILKIQAGKAFDEGIIFYLSENNIWLSEFIHPKYININI